MKYVWITSIVLAVILIEWSTESVLAAKLYVANNGIDSATCGDKSTPCRSISRAIANANTGDKIVVGPGRYGDLNGDGNFDDPGDEGAEVGGCSCLVRVTKQLSIESQNGAAATVLDAGGINVGVVRIEVSGTVFGKKNKGFTLTHAGGIQAGLIIGNSTSNVKITSNLAIANGGLGFRFNFSNTSHHQFQGNAAIANGTVGFSFDGSGHQLRDNVAIANGSDGFSFFGANHVLTGNLASANFIGFNSSGSGHQLTGNLAVANRVYGLSVIGGGNLLSNNSALGNGYFGILVGTTNNQIAKNNIFGNATNPILLTTQLNCGLLNSSGQPIAATNNFWGAATGPGVNPADNVCNDGAGSSTTAAPFATKELRVRNKVASFLNESRRLAPTASGNKTLFVATNGVGGNCGDEAHPCRTIGHAILAANPGDKIVVGPGRYTWELEPLAGSCGCVVLVNKPGITIESRDGAGATVIDATGHDVSVVLIAADGVVFGKKKKGFTLTGAGGTGDGLDTNDEATNARIAGNLAVANGGGGFNVNSTGNQYTGNMALANDEDGFVLSGTGTVASENTSIANREDGFDSFDTGLLVTGNVSSANGGNGFTTEANGIVFANNLASANRTSGFYLWAGSGPVLTNNAILGNRLLGVSAGISATVNQNNIFGNNSTAEPFTGSGLKNCGILNFSGASITASNNFWGSATGPGSDPVDTVCNVGPGSTTTTAPFATKEFKVKTVTPLEEPGLITPDDFTEKETSLNQLIETTPTKEGLLFRALGEASTLRLEVTDLSGRKIYDSGFVQGQTLSWARVTTQNRQIANGVYLYRLTARHGEIQETKSELRKLIISR